MLGLTCRPLLVVLEVSREGTFQTLLEHLHGLSTEVTPGDQCLDLGVGRPFENLETGIDTGRQGRLHTLILEDQHTFHELGDIRDQRLLLLGVHRRVGHDLVNDLVLIHGAHGRAVENRRANLGGVGDALDIRQTASILQLHRVVEGLRITTVDARINLLTTCHSANHVSLGTTGCILTSTLLQEPSVTDLADTDLLDLQLCLLQVLLVLIVQEDRGDLGEKCRIVLGIGLGNHGIDDQLLTLSVVQRGRGGPLLIDCGEVTTSGQNLAHLIGESLALHLGMVGSGISLPAILPATEFLIDALDDT